MITKIVLILSLLFLISCGREEKKQGESAKEVVDKYVNTLRTAPDKARRAGESLEKRDKDIEKSIDE